MGATPISPATVLYIIYMCNSNMYTIISKSKFIIYI